MEVESSEKEEKKETEEAETKAENRRG